VTERGGQMGLSDPDGSQDEDAVAGLGEPQAGQVAEQHSVIGEVVGFVPGVQSHGRVQAGDPRAEHRRAGLAAGDLIGQDQLEERGVAHRALPSQDEPFGQGVLEAAELQRAKGPHQVDTDRVERPAGRSAGRSGGRSGHGVVSSSGCAASLTPPRMRVSWAGPPKAYSAGSRANPPGS